MDFTEIKQGGVKKITAPCLNLNTVSYWKQD